MKKSLITIIVAIAVCAATAGTIIGIVAANKNSNNVSSTSEVSTESDNSTDSSDDVPENIGSLLFNTLSVNKDKVYGKVSNETDAFSFINEIKTDELTKYIVSLDIYGSQQVATKTIPLNEGDNVVYVIEMLDDEPQAIYEVTIRRRLIYKVSFYTNNGIRISDQQVEEDSCATMPKSPERRGYTFDKWNYDFSTPITKDTIINAKWNIITYNISYNLNGGTLDGENPTTYTVKDEITLIKPTKRGYNANWDNGGKIAKGSIGDKTFNANWTAIVYKISYNLNGGTINGENPTTYTVEDEITLVSPTKRGYNFASWDNGGKISKGSVGDITFNAKWDIIAYNISYNLNGGTIDGENPTTYTVEDEITLINPTKRGYNANWDNGGKIAKGSIGDITFSATYSIIVYKITYDCGKGANNTLNPLKYTIESETIILNDAYYINADFVEWQQNSVKITEIANGSIGDVTLTAVWNEYDVKLQENGDCYTVIGLNTNKTDIEIKPSYKGKKVTSISVNAFKFCSQITSITIPDSVPSIGASAFYGCSSLESITLPFIGASKTARKGYDQVFGYIFGYTTTSSMSSVSGATYQYHKSYEYYYYYIPSSLKTVVLSNSVTSIGKYAFYNCSRLTSITIPDSVSFIGYDAFDGCSKLTDIHISNISAWCNISGLSDLMHSSKKNLYLNDELITDLIIPDSVNSINYYAFKNCRKLTSITIPDSVTSIDGYAFDGCDQLKTVYYKGTKTQWNEISIGSVNNYLTNAMRYYYSKNEPALNSDGTAYDGNYWHYDSDGITPVIWKKES